LRALSWLARVRLTVQFSLGLNKAKTSFFSKDQIRSGPSPSEPASANHDSFPYKASEWKAPVGLPPPLTTNARKQARLLTAKLRGTEHANDLLGESNLIQFPFVQHCSKGGISTGEFSANEEDSSLTTSYSKKNLDVAKASNYPIAGAVPTGTLTFGASSSTQATTGVPIAGAVPTGTLTFGASSSTQAATGLPIAGTVPIGTLTFGAVSIGTSTSGASSSTQAATGAPMAGAVSIGTLTSGANTEGSIAISTLDVSYNLGDIVYTASV